MHERGIGKTEVEQDKNFQENFTQVSTLAPLYSYEANLKWSVFPCNCKALKRVKSSFAFTLELLDIRKSVNQCVEDSLISDNS
jgi:hypothetical protein